MAKRLKPITGSKIFCPLLSKGAKPAKGTRNPYVKKAFPTSYGTVIKRTGTPLKISQRDIATHTSSVFRQIGKHLGVKGIDRYVAGKQDPWQNKGLHGAGRVVSILGSQIKSGSKVKLDTGIGEHQVGDLMVREVNINGKRFLTARCPGQWAVTAEIVKARNGVNIKDYEIRRPNKTIVQKSKE